MKKGKGFRPDPISSSACRGQVRRCLNQILSSHSLVEGTMELPDILSISQRLAGKTKASDKSLYPEIIADLTETQLRGQCGISRAARFQRKTGKPYFIDKMPSNFLHVGGLIHLILPNTKSSMRAAIRWRAASPASNSTSPRGGAFLTGWSASAGTTAIMCC
ncbi:MAG: hypothetical protein R3C58_01845 [Parvularculaceae bacterium]